MRSLSRVPLLLRLTDALGRGMLLAKIRKRYIKMFTRLLTVLEQRGARWLHGVVVAALTRCRVGTAQANWSAGACRTCAIALQR